MAYVVSATVVVGEAEVATSLDVPINAGHQSGDLLVIIAQQDVGTGTLTGPSGWSTLLSGSQATQNAQRTWGWYKLATSDAEPNANVSSTLNDDLHAAMIVIRGADQTTPIDVVSGAQSTATTAAFTVTGVTTTAANCLVLYGVGNDNGAISLLVPDNGQALEPVAVRYGAGGAISVGYRYQQSAGATGTVTWRRSRTAGGTGFCFAVRDDGDNAQALTLAARPHVLAYYGLANSDSTAPSPQEPWIASATELAPDQITSTIDGKSVSSSQSTHTFGSTSAGTLLDPTSMVLSSTENLGSPGWVGHVLQPTTTTDLSDSLLSFNFSTVGVALSHTPGPLLLLLADSSGNWVALEAVLRPGLIASTWYQVFLDTAATPYASNGTMDWSAVARIGWVWLRAAGYTANQPGWRIRNLVRVAKTGGVVVVGGGSRKPPELSAAAMLRNSIDGWYGERSRLLSVQGVSQLLDGPPIEFGNGSAASRINLLGASIETLPPFATTIPERFYRHAPYSASIRIRAGASDEMLLRACVMSSEDERDFIVDASSSASATYDFAGAVLSGWRLKLLASGVTVNSATITRSRGIELDGCALYDCDIGNALETPAVVCDDPSAIERCNFTASPDGGHAIEITTPGTYTFAGNTFSGYGADGTTDAAIYNNSGGAVTLNVGGGGDTPTVRNAAGCTTTINSGATLTLTNLVPGSDIVILDAGTTTERVNVDANAGSTYAFTYTATGNVDICCYKAGYVPFFVRSFYLSTNDASLPIAQVVDRNYSNP